MYIKTLALLKCIECLQIINVLSLLYTLSKDGNKNFNVCNQT